MSAFPSLPSFSPGAESWCGPLLELCFLIWGMLGAPASGVLLIPRQSQLLSRKPACHLQTSQHRAGSLNTNFVHGATNLRETQECSELQTKSPVCLPMCYLGGESQAFIGCPKRSLVHKIGQILTSV